MENVTSNVFNKGHSKVLDQLKEEQKSHDELVLEHRSLCNSHDILKANYDRLRKEHKNLLDSCKELENRAYKGIMACCPWL